MNRVVFISVLMILSLTAAARHRTPGMVADTSVIPGSKGPLAEKLDTKSNNEKVKSESGPVKSGSDPAKSKTGTTKSGNAPVKSGVTTVTKGNTATKNRTGKPDKVVGSDKKPNSPAKSANNSGTKPFSAGNKADSTASKLNTSTKKSNVPAKKPNVPGNEASNSASRSKLPAKKVSVGGTSGTSSTKKASGASTSASGATIKGSSSSKKTSEAVKSTSVSSVKGSSASKKTKTVKVSTSVRSSTTKSSSKSHSRKLKKGIGIELFTPLAFKYAILLDVPVEKVIDDRLLEVLDHWYGTRYRYGGETRKGIDCSAFTQAFMVSYYDYELPRTAEEQYVKCKRIKKKKLRQGDLVFFKTRGPKGGISHVGVYLLNDRFVHSATSTGVRISNLNDDYYKAKYAGAGRIK